MTLHQNTNADQPLDARMSHRSRIRRLMRSGRISGERRRLSRLSGGMLVISLGILSSGCASMDGPDAAATQRGETIDTHESQTSPPSDDSASGDEECLALDSVNSAAGLMDVTPEVSLRETFERGHELGRFQCAIVIDEHNPDARGFTINYDGLPFDCPTEIYPSEAADSDGPGLFGLLTEGAVSYEICVPAESRSVVISVTYTDTTTKNALERQDDVRDLAVMAVSEKDALRAAAIATARNH